MKAARNIMAHAWQAGSGDVSTLAIPPHGVALAAQARSGCSRAAIGEPVGASPHKTTQAGAASLPEHE